MVSSHLFSRKNTNSSHLPNMSLLKIRSAPIILIEDDANKNIIPLLLELVPSERSTINLFCYEQPAAVWRSVFHKSNIKCYEEFKIDSFNQYTSSKCTVIVDSVNQMALCLGWNECLKCFQRLSRDSKVEKLILVLHKDCLSHSSKLQIHLNHLANAVISYGTKSPFKVSLKIKKGSKVSNTDETISYDIKTSTLRLTPIVKQNKKDDEPDNKPSPGSLTTFKIEVDQLEKMEKSKLKLPYMSKIHEGESKVYYEPDAVDDWDEEDPDEDLDI